MPRGRKVPVTDEQIVQTYLELRSEPKTAKALKVGGSTVHRALLLHNVPRMGMAEYRARATKYLGDEEKLRAEYERGATIKELAEKYSGAPISGRYAVIRAIRRAGGVLRDKRPSRLTADELELIRRLNAQGVSQAKISVQIDRSQTFVSRVMLNHGIRPNKHTGLGRHTTLDGYVKIFVDPDDPLAAMRQFAGYALEHRIVMARHLGRPLKSSETVHHINGDKGDNRIENLQIRQGRHGNGVVMCCLDCGSQNIGPRPIADAA